MLIECTIVPILLMRNQRLSVVSELLSRLTAAAWLVITRVRIQHSFVFNQSQHFSIAPSRFQKSEKNLGSHYFILFSDQNDVSHKNMPSPFLTCPVLSSGPHNIPQGQGHGCPLALGQTVGGQLAGFQESQASSSLPPTSLSFWAPLQACPTFPPLPSPSNQRKVEKQCRAGTPQAEWGFWSDVEFTWNAPVLFWEGRHPRETMKWKRKQLKQNPELSFGETSPIQPG